MNLAHTEFSKAVLAYINKIPKGKVATYGQIAALAGKPHGARGVGWLLHSSSQKHKLPWHRVLNSQGRISFAPRTRNYIFQKNRLQNEGVEFSPADKINLKTFQWHKRPRARKPKRGLPTMFSS